ncbi:UNVERIFIED_CONTAM: hypothetical protein FKN15_017074 [Acipenser sinensis]
MLWLSYGNALRLASQMACTARSPATYILVFTGQWNPTTFPKQYPMFRPPAQWSKLIETKEVKKSTRSVHGVYRAPGISNGIGHTSTELHMQPRSPRIMSAELLPPGWLQRTLAVMLWLSCGSALRLANQMACTARSPATYILVFTGQWNPTTFPKQYPMFRPPAQWSKLIAVSHSSRFHLWQEGFVASQGVQMFAERGVTAALIKETKEVKKSTRSVHGVYRAPGISNGIGHTSTELHMQPRSPRPKGEEPERPTPEWEEPERPTPEWEEPERPTPEWEEPERPTPEWEEPERPTPEWEEPERPTPEWEEPERPTPEWEEPERPTPEWEEPERPTPEWEEPERPTPEWEEPERPTPEWEEPERPTPEWEEPERPTPEWEEPERPTPEWEEPERPTPEWEEPERPTPEWEEPERPTPEWEEPERPTPEWEEPERPTPEWEEPERPTPEWEEPERPTPEWEEPERPTPEWGEPERPQPKRGESVRPQPKEGGVGASIAQEGEGGACRALGPKLPAEGECLLVPPPPAEGECLLSPCAPAEDECLLSPSPPAEGECLLGPRPPAEDECLLVSLPPPALTPAREGDKPQSPARKAEPHQSPAREAEQDQSPAKGGDYTLLPPSSPGDHMLLPPPLLPPQEPEGEELQAPPPENFWGGEGQDAGVPQQPLFMLLKAARRAPAQPPQRREPAPPGAEELELPLPPVPPPQGGRWPEPQKGELPATKKGEEVWRPLSPAAVSLQEFLWPEPHKGELPAMKKGEVGGPPAPAAFSLQVGTSMLSAVPLPAGLSLMGKIIPSPDWFVGVDSLDLCDGGQWVQEVSLDLYPYDAGTDSGFTFSSPNYLTVPQENITQITSQNPNHPANSFYYPKLEKLPPLARLTLTQQTGHSPGHKQFSNHILREAGSKRYSETPLDCEVSRWSSWGLCLEKCGRPGIRHRTRYILLQPANSGTACPDLEEGETCSSETASEPWPGQPWEGGITTDRHT